MGLCRMAYSLNPSSDNCYKGTTCLVNKLNIRDEEKLEQIEAQITFAKAVLLEEKAIDDHLIEFFKNSIIVVK